jgi:hypothetical protein
VIDDEMMFGVDGALHVVADVAAFAEHHGARIGIGERALHFGGTVTVTKHAIADLISICSLAQEKQKGLPAIAD